MTKRKKIDIAPKSLREYSFTEWERWNSRTDLPQLDRPGIYVIAKSKKSLTGKPFSWIKEIAYVGMSASKGGLASRMYQFETTLKGSAANHGGATRVRSHHKNIKVLRRYLYVAVMPLPRKNSGTARAKTKAKNAIYGLELFCLAEYICRFQKIPQFNDWARSPK